jgi:hypothetical protein
MRWIGFVAAAAACGDASFGVKCERILSNLCSRQVECDELVSYATCVEDLRATWVCDPDKTVADLDVCLADIPVASCQTPTPETCFQVLCDASEGCGFTDTFTTTDTALTTTY